MHNLNNYAAKSSFSIQQTGPCQLCGSMVKNGINECFELFHNTLGLTYTNASYAKSHVLLVDAHALQHSELQGEISDHFHLLRLGYVLQNDHITGSTTDPNFLNTVGLNKKMLPPLIIPQPLKRGDTTIKHVINHKTPMQFHSLALKWGESVWDSWSENHQWVHDTLKNLN